MDGLARKTGKNSRILNVQEYTLFFAIVFDYQRHFPSSFPEFAFGTGSPHLSSTNEIIEQCEENINGDMHAVFFSDK